ncbi:hypothetical protein [Thermaerobacter composti]|uniref:Uncharacterized protein n=1 Tax=Thermaerobacter composti TaxID=554949 RepID=A0ABZ0QQ28_9FIRM|nr:hypothetical protein [Thermaerobacter composti]WPD18789.1 hypothetical protein Q5761_10545 [Thermaerobacter composti]
MARLIEVPVGSWWSPLAAVAWVALLHALPVAVGLALARRTPRRPGGQAGPTGAQATPRTGPAGAAGGRGLAAGFFTHLWMANLVATLGLGLDGPGWLPAAWLHAAFLGAFLIPAYLGWMRPGGRVGRRVGWTWAIALGLDGAAGAWTVRAALETGGLAVGRAVALAAMRAALGWGVGLQLAEGRRPPRRRLLAAGVVAGLPPVVAASLPADALWVAWTLVLRAAAAGLILAGLAGGRLVPGARRRRGEAQWAFAVAMAGAMAVMFLLSRW